MTLLDIKQGQGYIAKIESNSFVDGEGVRCSVYVSGCPFNCVDVTTKPHKSSDMARNTLIKY